MVFDAAITFRLAALSTESLSIAHPILYVHGAGGSANDWRYHFDHLDRSRYQAWFFQYPSGLRLGQLAEGLDDFVTVLHDRHRFEKLIVVAHSMGGLVSRGFLARVAGRERSYDTAFVTFSTPWLGHRAAKQGKRFAPSVVPSWIDMTPGSEYLLELSEEPLRGVPHVLFFSHNRGLLPLGVNNDGAVSLSSQLARWAQAGALRIEGFDAGHEGILESEEAFASFEAALEELLAVLDQR